MILIPQFDRVCGRAAVTGSNRPDCCYSRHGGVIPVAGAQSACPVRSDWMSSARNRSRGIRVCPRPSHGFVHRLSPPIGTLDRAAMARVDDKLCATLSTRRATLTPIPPVGSSLALCAGRSFEGGADSVPNAAGCQCVGYKPETGEPTAIWLQCCRAYRASVTKPTERPAFIPN